MPEKKHGICVYCGKHKSLTVDHVPPRCLLAPPYPPNLITVPACVDCNQGFKANDEYTRTVATINQKASSHHVPQRNLASVVRSLQKPEARKFAEHLGRHMSVSPIYDWRGRGPVRTLSIDRFRMNATGERIMRGLWFEEKKTPLPISAKVQAQVVFGVNPDHELTIAFVETFDLMSDHRHRAVGDAFSYAAGFRDDKSAWFTTLYGYFGWFGTIDLPVGAPHEAYAEKAKL